MMHELDRNPAVIKRGSLIYPSHLRRKGLEGEVKLLVQINETGRGKGTGNGIGDSSGLCRCILQSSRGLGL